MDLDGDIPDYIKNVHPTFWSGFGSLQTSILH